MPKIRGGYVGALQELEHGLIPRGAPAREFIGENELVELSAVGRAIGENQGVGVTRWLRVGVGVEGRLAETFARPEAATADLVRIGFARDTIGQVGALDGAAQDGRKSE